MAKEKEVTQSQVMEIPRVIVHCGVICRCVCKPHVVLWSHGQLSLTPREGERIDKQERERGGGDEISDGVHVYVLELLTQHTRDVMIKGFGSQEHRCTFVHCT